MYVKNAFTMIELIFVIVILGVLAAVAIPKLSATRNDAEAAKVANELGNCIEHAGGAYHMDEVFDMSSRACNEVSVNNTCFTLAPDNTTGTLLITDIASAPGSVCALAQSLVAKNNLSSAAGVSHQF